MKKIWQQYKYVFIIVVSIVLVRLYVITPVVVAGPSMMPTLMNEDKIYVNKLTPIVGEYERFDVVVFTSKEGPLYVKRIIGLPGETVEFNNDQLYINGKQLNESFLNEVRTNISHGNLTGNFSLNELYNIKEIPENMYFVLGDNRLNSNDSREPELVGLVDKDDILGKAELVIFPFNHFHFLE